MQVTPQCTPWASFPPFKQKEYVIPPDRGSMEEKCHLSPNATTISLAARDAGAQATGAQAAGDQATCAQVMVAQATGRRQVPRCLGDVCLGNPRARATGTQATG